ncbi:MAG: ATP-binding cassette domain-containing protein, partial [Verrucomicrobiota bacterium]
MTPAIRVQQLTKKFKTYRKKPGLKGAIQGLFHREYDETIAANNISFEVQPGEFVGFLGPNGAGKTTTLKMLSGLLHPTSGSATVLGFTPSNRENDFKKQFSLV